VRIVSHHYATLEEALAAEMPPMSSVVIGSSVSPTGRYAAALPLVPSASGYLAVELYERDESGWTSYGGGSGGGISWSSLVDVSTGRASDGNLGVLRYGEERRPEPLRCESSMRASTPSRLYTGTSCSSRGTRSSRQIRESSSSSPTRGPKEARLGGHSGTLAHKRASRG
jgi:hypothetical protein